MLLLVLYQYISCIWRIFLSIYIQSWSSTPRPTLDIKWLSKNIPWWTYQLHGPEILLGKQQSYNNKIYFSTFREAHRFMLISIKASHLNPSYVSYLKGAPINTTSISITISSFRLCLDLISSVTPYTFTHYGDRRREDLVQLDRKLSYTCSEQSYPGRFNSWKTWFNSQNMAFWHTSRLTTWVSPWKWICWQQAKRVIVSQHTASSAFY